MSEDGDSGLPRPAAGQATFRLFVSSTFSDLAAERDILQERVFPELRKYCAARGARFQAIDLRWGVSEQAAVDQQTMNICLQEIERCQRTTPRPSFLVLLGDSYGWRPPPAQVPADDFEAILSRVAEEERQILVDWYRRDENAVPAEYRLLPRTGEHAAYAEPHAWLPVEERLCAILERAADQLGLRDEDHRAFRASATEQEIVAGALQVDEPEDKVFCFLRTIDPRPEGEKTFVDPGPGDRLRRLKAELRRHLERHVGTDRLSEVIHEETVGWTGDGPALDAAYFERLAAWATTALAAAIERQLSRIPGLAEDGDEKRLLDPLSAEADLRAEVRQHLAFAAERRRHFVNRRDVLAAVAAYLAGNLRRPFCVAGEGGMGKTAVLAQAMATARRDHPEAELVARFIDATPGSADGRGLLDGICREISHRYGVKTSDLPVDYRDLAPELGERMALATADRPLILIVDALDRLGDRDPARSLAWIPTTLPEHVRLVLSSRPGETLKKMTRTRAWVHELQPMGREDGARLLAAWLASARPPRRLQPHQSKAVLEAFERSGGQPLYLRLAFEEARRWPAYLPRDAAPPAEWGEHAPDDAVPRKLANGIEGIVQDNLLARLAHEDNHGEVLVSHALGYLAASRHGLAEDELLDLLSRDPEVYRWFLRGTYHVPADLVRLARAHLARDGREVSTRRAASWIDEVRRRGGAELDDLLDEVLPQPGPPWLPVVLWSRLSTDLRPYLSQRMAEGGSLLTFYHRELGAMAEAAYLEDGGAPRLHGRLAEYFRARADPGGDRSWTGGDVRGLSELPHHLVRAERWQELHDTLTDFRFLERKVTEVGAVRRGATAGGLADTLYTGVYQLQEDFDHALESAGTAAARRRRPVLLTPVDFGDGSFVRCPFCSTLVPLQDDWLGADATCPEDGCGGPWKVNPFVCERPEWTKEAR